jgi:SMI1 / KNR4 family (SUKH-1)
MTAVLRQARAVSEADIALADERTGRPMPGQLRCFYTEMGDAFEFVPDDVPNSPLDGWVPNHLSDYEIWNSGFSTAIEEEADEEIQSRRPRVEPKLLREEAERRKLWVPFYGFVGGGDVLCLDSEGKVRFYEALVWRACPNTWDFVLADSLIDFVEKWSRFCFVAPGCNWTSFCTECSGIFDWAPSHFSLGIPRGKVGAAA